MQRAGAAERHQGKIPRIEALLNGDEAQRAEHVLVDDVEDALRRLVQVEAQRACDLRYRFFGRLACRSIILPPRSFGGRRPSTTLASVTVG